MANGGADKFPKDVIGDGEGTVGNDETDGDSDSVGEATSVMSRPLVWVASGEMSIYIGVGGNLEVGMNIVGDAPMMIVMQQLTPNDWISSHK
jgi:hypothetical protein